MRQELKMEDCTSIHGDCWNKTWNLSPFASSNCLYKWVRNWNSQVIIKFQYWCNVLKYYVIDRRNVSLIKIFLLQPLQLIAKMFLDVALGLIFLLLATGTRTVMCFSWLSLGVVDFYQLRMFRFFVVYVFRICSTSFVPDLDL